MSNPLVEFEKEEKQLSKSTALLIGHAVAVREETRGKNKNCFCFYFLARTFGLGERGAHRQPQAGSTVLLQIQTGSFGEPPTPSSSDLTVALDRY